VEHEHVAGDVLFRGIQEVELRIEAGAAAGVDRHVFDSYPARRRGHLRAVASDLLAESVTEETTAGPERPLGGSSLLQRVPALAVEAL
jgi:hypothetical protein